MKIPFRKRPPVGFTVRYVRFDPPRELAEYGFDGTKPIKDDRTSSGFVLPWEAIDAERDRRVKGGPCQLVVIGEFVDDATGLRSPSLAINAAWMEANGYWRETEMRNGKMRHGSWKSRDSLTVKSA